MTESPSPLTMLLSRHTKRREFIAGLWSAMFATQPSSGLIAIPDSFTGQHRDLIIALAARYRLPALYAIPSATPSGGLMAYAVDTRDTMQRAAGYVDRILKGAKPADLPVQQPARFQLSINLKTAKAIGLDVAPNLAACCTGRSPGFAPLRMRST